MASLEDANTIAALAHKGEVDKAGHPYILHPLRMMMLMKSGAVMMAAILHDVVENTEWTQEQLREQGFSQEITEESNLIILNADQRKRIYKNELLKIFPEGVNHLPKESQPGEFYSTT